MIAQKKIDLVQELVSRMAKGITDTEVKFGVWRGDLKFFGSDRDAVETIANKIANDMKGDNVIEFKDWSHSAPHVERGMQYCYKIVLS
jgi:hypothetical protein